MEAASLAVSLRSAVCLLGGFPALAGVDLDVAQGEVLLVAGPNGAGKSTLLRLLAGLLPLSGGAGSVLGHDLATERRALRRCVGLLGHESPCYDDLSARENVRFWTGAGGRPLAAADAALEEVGLGRAAGTPFARLSEGQRRRCDLALLLARAPHLVLLDEPHAGLDEVARGILEGSLRRWATDGCTVVLVSHELERARRVASREVHLIGGVVLGVRDGAEVRDGDRGPEGDATP